MNMSNNKKWLAVIIYTLLIFISIPTIRQVWNFIGPRIGYIVVVVSFVLALGFLYIYSRSIFLVIILILASVLIFKFVKLPIERIHFIEYGILGWLAHRAGGWKSIFYVVAIGILDELIQKITPNRYFDIKDICTNIIGGGSGMILRAYGR